MMMQGSLRNKTIENQLEGFDDPFASNAFLPVENQSELYERIYIQKEEGLIEMNGWGHGSGSGL